MWRFWKMGPANQLKVLLDQASYGLTESDRKNAGVLIDAGELQIAFELICEQLYEHDTRISFELLQAIRSIAAAMKFEDSSWSFLERNLRP